MKHRFSIQKFFAFISLIVLPFSSGFAGGSPVGVGGSEDDYDRLDGTGRSGKKVHVVEWEGNLEVHVYPKGSLKSLALKLDDRNPQKPVMVIGYRFNDNPKNQLIRRAILGIPMPSRFQAYKDIQEQDFDKVIISPHGLGSPLVALQLEPEPKQLYPEGHPALAAQSAPPQDEQRKPASKDGVQAPKGFDEETGTIKPFFH